MRRRYGSSYGSYWPPYVPVAERRAMAERSMRKMQIKGEEIRPVKIVGRTIARTFWGKGWCDHLEAFGDFSNRLPRGRSYVRNGSVCHLSIERGLVDARVAGSSLYCVKVEVKPLQPTKWKTLQRLCAGRIGSLIELLQGQLSDEIMGSVTDPKEGLFPLLGEIKYTCDCPDWADMCKHVSAVMYGIGARLDEQPELLFRLRGVDHHDLVSGETTAATLAGKGSSRSRRRRLEDAELATVFGVELEDDSVEATVEAQPPEKAARRPRGKSSAKTSPVRTGEKRAQSRKAPAEKIAPFMPTGRAVARLRKRLAMSVTDFARAVGVSPASVSSWERRDGAIRFQTTSLAGLRQLHARAASGRSETPNGRRG